MVSDMSVARVRKSPIAVLIIEWWATRQSLGFVSLILQCLLWNGERYLKCLELYVVHWQRRTVEMPQTASSHLTVVHWGRNESWNAWMCIRPLNNLHWERPLKCLTLYKAIKQLYIEGGTTVEMPNVYPASCTLREERQLKCLNVYQLKFPKLYTAIKQLYTGESDNLYIEFVFSITSCCMSRQTRML